MFNYNKFWASSYTHWKDVKTKAFRNIKKIILVLAGEKARAANLLNISSRCDYLGSCSFSRNETSYYAAYISEVLEIESKYCLG